MSLYIGTGSHGPALLDNPINTKPSDVVLFMRAVKAQTSQSTGKTRVALKYRISTRFPDFFNLIYASSECSGKIIYYYRII